MELRVLRYFLAVAKEESITSAAQSLNVTQPTLSKQLMELEDELGKKLFLRGNRKITLTEDGLFLRKRAQEIIDLADKTTSDFNNDYDDIRGNVYIGGGETDAMRFIAKTVKELQKEYPNIRYHLFSGNADDVTERLDKGLLDFGILIEPANMEKYDYIKLPVNDVWGLLMKKDCELAQKKMICAEDLKGIPILTSRQTLVQNVISGWSGQDFQTFNIVATYNLVYNASLMVDEGAGYALCLDKLINTTGNSNLCFRPLEPRLEAHLNIVWKKYQVFSKATKKFLNKLQSEINNFVSE
ncbi:MULTISPECIES: LysR family transcriptional regulator [unclassified Clostridioides]|uniref:LysR family transcriptional regulator n=1 Tax=unclassified Clostridioides TaxID=2635829 RepID=UPI001D12F344|nr:LysR family transcriptional regulator [Clostridioides sp. ZZV14-6150]MCC0670284.1 LysR family transcriptional regulator [Clostridioides sp. ZZV14-6153]MCC0728279.1 LysR family transcriptional regulator [Clostridioides sp. ZZV14-6045]MCC0730923.1 LysR family transcriptional regulator [Clostridioides sp. ZZV14-6048]MCC0736822.1 LysR family transcriptional regulator [Clostridioides sp. ZZV14-6009]MCC0739021.1 LysR family transcriptional regulator [Clostridioides sp. ZZV14-5902]MCC0743010.1 Ly